MKTIGIIGGVTWHSTAKYYKLINEVVNARLGGVHSAQILLYSVDFDEIEDLQENHGWDKVAERLIEIAKILEKGGADFILICANTMHKLVGLIELEIGIPILHIADATARAIKAEGLQKVGLLGTKYTMEEDFYKDKLEHHGLDVILPTKEDRKIISDIIYNELVIGKILGSSKKEYLRIIDDFVENGAEGIILGCTEIGILVSSEDTEIPLFDTTPIHALAAVEHVLHE